MGQKQFGPRLRIKPCPDQFKCDMVIEVVAKPTRAHWPIRDVSTVRLVEFALPDSCSPLLTDFMIAHSLAQGQIRARALRHH